MMGKLARKAIETGFCDGIEVSWHKRREVINCPFQAPSITEVAACKYEVKEVE